MEILLILLFAIVTLLESKTLIPRWQSSIILPVMVTFLTPEIEIPCPSPGEILNGTPGWNGIPMPGFSTIYSNGALIGVGVTGIIYSIGGSVGGVDGISYSTVFLIVNPLMFT